MTQFFRSLIFVPGNNSRFLEKAKKLQADIVCFDLEDSVPDIEKVNARKLIKNALKSRNYTNLQFLFVPIPLPLEKSQMISKKSFKRELMVLLFLKSIM